MLETLVRKYRLILYNILIYMISLLLLSLDSFINYFIYI